MYLADSKNWYLERTIYLMAGTFSLIGAALAFFHNPYWLILNGLVGINLLIFSLTGFCIMANILIYIGIKPKC
ncbi:MAG: DUF2892 domain-containing protein [Leptospiraceae bacterium]|nr:DUF2892 domain-containing protein [Leptospiraceae bacterium]MCP5494548.1 DUF2892 domain-containing protein [Leptospiraceae bacterium]